MHKFSSFLFIFFLILCSLTSAGLGAIPVQTSKCHKIIYAPLEIILDIQARVATNCQLMTKL